MLIEKVNPVAFEPMNEIHNRELHYVNSLYDAIINGKDIEKAYEEFLNDVKEHFAFEEKLMEKYNFFAIVPHKMEHARILNELTELKSRLNDTEYLKDYLTKAFIPWLENHINTIDTVTAGFFKMINATM
ncbi:hemerythrin [Nautilia sp. PV-1]|uniref:bacteriohemerythrin n=1 Tax=Nautilia sp. PV-1 TaxID=2579250 RepID=UPI000FDCAB51|nr:hemerythrin family protein [Nautilia sp. PV-1]AZV46747.1 hemerythrin [Nautilia sp. PV-1]